MYHGPITRDVDPSDAELVAALTSILDENRQFSCNTLAEMLFPNTVAKDGERFAAQVARDTYAKLVKRAANAATFDGRGLAGFCVDSGFPAPRYRIRMRSSELFDALKAIGDK